MYNNQFSQPLFLCSTCEHQDICKIKDSYKKQFEKTNTLFEQPTNFTVQVGCLLYTKKIPTHLAPVAFTSLEIQQNIAKKT